MMPKNSDEEEYEQTDEQQVVENENNFNIETVEKK